MPTCLAPDKPLVLKGDVHQVAAILIYSKMHNMYREVCFIRPKSGPEMVDFGGLAGPPEPARPQKSTISGPDFGRTKTTSR